MDVTTFPTLKYHCAIENHRKFTKCKLCINLEDVIFHKHPYIRTRAHTHI